MQSRAVPILDTAGEIAECFGVAGDTAERHEAQARLCETRDALALATRALHLGGGPWNFATTDAGWDMRGRRIIGMAREVCTIAARMTRVRAENRHRIEEEVTANLREKQPFDLVSDVTRPDVIQHFVQGTGDFLREHDSDRVYGTGLARDATE